MSEGRITRPDLRVFSFNLVRKVTLLEVTRDVTGWGRSKGEGKLLWKWHVYVLWNRTLRKGVVYIMTDI